MLEMLAQAASQTTVGDISGAVAQGGVVVALVSVIGWIVKAYRNDVNETKDQLFGVIQRNSDVIANNTAAVQQNSGLSVKALEAMTSVQKDQSTLRTLCEERCGGKGN